LRRGRLSRAGRWCVGKAIAGRTLCVEGVYRRGREEVEQDAGASGRLARAGRLASRGPVGGAEKKQSRTLVRRKCYAAGTLRCAYVEAKRGGLLIWRVCPSSFIALAYARAHPGLESQNMDVSASVRPSVFSAPAIAPPDAKRPPRVSLPDALASCSRCRSVHPLDADPISTFSLTRVHTGIALRHQRVECCALWHVRVPTGHTETRRYLELQRT